jgi:hypothetical protein
MHNILLALLLSLGFNHVPTTILSAIESAAPDIQTARIMLIWGFKESALDNRAVGDEGRAQCFLQIKDMGRMSTLTCARRWVQLLQFAENVCGSRRAALGSLASGRCGGARKLVERRLVAAGVTLPP